MNILGISFLSDASACVLRDGHLVAAISEERLNREKLWFGIPHRAIAEALKIAGLRIEEIDFIATHGQAPSEPDRLPYEAKERDIRAATGLSPGARDEKIKALWSRFSHESMVLGQRTPQYLAQIAQLGRPMKVYGHHQSHAATAYYGSSYPEAMVLTADGWGEDASSTLWRCKGLTMERLARSNTFDSLGYFYGSVTKALDFIPHRHEGKVLGLAAYCDEPRSYKQIRQLVDVLPKEGRFIGRLESSAYLPRFENPELKRLIAEFSREDIAAATQKTLEEVVTALVVAQGSAARHLCVAGGIFANVKLNHRLADLKNVEEIFVFPNMGDGGLGVGAAWLAHVEITRERPQPFRTAYLGHDPSDKEIAEAVAQSGLTHRRETNVAEAIAELLAKDVVVARCTGAMEFGPRALGHRSILYHAKDATVNNWLNERLNRSEFMPFAPATLAEEAPRFYRNLEASGAAAAYMTVTCDCTAEMRSQAPAAVHVDGTARPQLVSATGNPDFHAILSGYRARTGLCSVINTSFNMHEEPIVCTAEDAVRAFRASGIGVLALGDFIVQSAEGIMPR